MMHARDQVLEYFKNVISDGTSFTCTVHRTKIVPLEEKVAIDLMIDDETIAGDNQADEYESTFGVMARVAPMVVALTVTSNDGRRAINKLAGDIEVLLATEDGAGDHEIEGAPVSCQYVAMTNEQETEGHEDQNTIALVFQTSYRTAPGKPFDLI